MLRPSTSALRVTQRYDNRQCQAVGIRNLRPGARFVGGLVLRTSSSPKLGVLYRTSTGLSAVSRGISRCATKRRTVKTLAIAVPQAPILTQELAISKDNVLKVVVEQLEDGAQKIGLTTNLPAGKLLLHWGVEGGQNYKGGWRLPGDKARPPGTNQYKDRALQSPFKRNGEFHELDIYLPSDEASDVLNFVFKDEATNTWFDNSGSNFKLPLRLELMSQDFDDGLQVPSIPKQLCDMWAWLGWDAAGRPSRSEQDASAEYDSAVQELNALMMRGVKLDDLWKVAKGEVHYEEFRKNTIVQKLGTSGSVKKAAAPPAPSPAPSVPAPSKQLPEPSQDLIGVQAYVLWEQAGKPQGSDFSSQARQVIMDKLRSGMTLEQVERNLKEPQPQQQKQPTKPAAQASPPPAPAPAAPQQQRTPSIGQLGRAMSRLPARNPLDMIKPQQPPLLSQDKATVEEKPLDFLVQRFAVDPQTKWRRTYQLNVGKAELLCAVRQENEDSPIRLDIITDVADRVVLHWAVCVGGSKDWVKAPEEVWPENTEVVGNTATDTPFHHCDDEECDVEIMGAKVPLQRCTVMLPPDHDFSAITFVIRSEDRTMWYKDAGGNFIVPVPSLFSVVAPPQQLDELVGKIVEAESSSMWTLMHRYNRAADLISEVLAGKFKLAPADAMARIYIWLRYSATRQITWQRNYNTQPRILSAAQERLTNSLANAHKQLTGEAQEWVRNMFGTVGRGGDGQKIRDEILNIMHRNHIPERKGLWMEEWHQKLHNNTTPDDVPICEAYLAFLEANGNVGAYWRVLSDAGIDRHRLETFDRPILAEPDYMPDKRGALIAEFRNYLGILKAVHSGADLQASASAAGNNLPSNAKGYLGYVLSHRTDGQVLPFLEAAVEARTELAPALPGRKDLLYLDLALEDQVRQAAERGAGAGFGAAAMMRPLLQNLALTVGDNEEVCFCLKAWNGLPASVRMGGRPSREEALLAVAVVNRIRRAISTISDNVIMRIGDVSKTMGQSFGVQSWAVDLFAEEVVRGGPAFAVSLVLSSIEPTLRQAAALGSWQVISPQEVTGKVLVVSALHTVQDNVYKEPTVLVVEHVSGEEEIPEGAVAVLTPDAPDVLSHVSVRARNMRVLFATCHDSAPLDAIRGSQGRWLHFQTSAAGAVTWSEASGPVGPGAGVEAPKNRQLKVTVPTWCGKWVVGMDDYGEGVVGAKSKNLARLRGKLPNWVALPASITVPFGSFEQVLDQPANASIKRHLAQQVEKLGVAMKGGAGPLQRTLSALRSVTSFRERLAVESPSVILEDCRAAAMQVAIPPELRSDLAAAMKAAGIPAPDSEQRWAMALEALKGVWASKYNERAYYSMKKVGLNFDDIRMAVLVQRVVPAQYAFVLHTKNPSNNDETEVYGELVKGLGESLVSGMVPGSAVAFKGNKKHLDNPEVLCYASKSEGMFVRETLIFRSDSNGEDLEGYAGAGLYESITMDLSELKKVDYMDDKLVTDPGFRKALLAKICKVGNDIEVALGSAQDVEGVVGPDGNITVVQTRPQV